MTLNAYCLEMIEMGIRSFGNSIDVGNDQTAVENPVFGSREYFQSKFNQVPELLAVFRVGEGISDYFIVFAEGCEVTPELQSQFQNDFGANVYLNWPKDEELTPTSVWAQLARWDEVYCAKDQSTKDNFYALFEKMRMRLESPYSLV